MSKQALGEVLALIPARGGSKSVPRKNIIPLLGKPMIAWAIEHALAAKNITRVIVSTDDRDRHGREGVWGRSSISASCGDIR